MTKFTRDQAVEVAIDQILADDDEGEAHTIALHVLGCPAVRDEACECPMRTIVMPPAKATELWWWERMVDRLARQHFRDV